MGSCGSGVGGLLGGLGCRLVVHRFGCGREGGGLDEGGWI